MQLSLKSLATLVVAAAPFLFADAAVVYVTPQEVVEYVTEAPVQLFATATAPAVIKVVDKTVQETEIIYTAKTVQVTSIRTTVITVISHVEPNKVTPANTRVQDNIYLSSIHTSFSVPKAVYPIVTSVAEPLASDSPSATPSTPTTAITLPASTTAAVIASSPPTTVTSQTATPAAVETTSAAASVSTVGTPLSVAPASSAAPSPVVSSSSEQAPSPVVSSSSTLSAAPSAQPAVSTAATIAPVLTTGVSGGYYSNQDIFQPVAVDAPPSVFPQNKLSSVNLPSGVDSSGPIHTNKFYSNMIIDDQTQPVYCMPYKLTYLKATDFQGIAVSYTSSSQRVFGPTGSQTNSAEYFVNPVGYNSFVFGATQFTKDNMNLKITNMDTLSALASVVSGSGKIDFPMVQGMGFVTAIYNGQVTPKIQSPLGIKTVSKLKHNLRSDVKKYKVVLGNDITWALYVMLPSASSTFDLTVDGTTNSIIGTTNDAVTIQIAVESHPTTDNDVYDNAAGRYLTGASLYGSLVSDTVANHGINYESSGTNTAGVPLIFALPHHVVGFVPSMSSKKSSVVLDSTAKGSMSAYLTNSFDFSDTLPRQIMFLPWSQASAFGKGLSYSTNSLKLIAAAANAELKQDMIAQIMTDSTYFSGKGLDKFAYILLVIHEILQDKNASRVTLERVKGVFGNFTANKQAYPLFYDTVYKGITSSASLKTNDNNADFGSPVYSDHHFHYGYFIHAAAVVGYVDRQFGGTWANDNKAWVNSLIRDVANPSKSDTYFPVSRYFDWYSGHSWAKGLFASADGKDQESSSEDYNFAYGMKLWGRVTGDRSMEARGDLMLAVMKRSMGDYYLMQNDNTVQPGTFIGNKIPGITFENKLHHTTYFGNNIEYIQGIHMLPITPVSSFLRTPTFVQQEWNQLLGNVAPTLNSGWAGVLRLNQALFDPQTAYNYFSDSNFKTSNLDGGASLTWCLAFSAGVGGSQA